jgi:hypothetical protein
MNYKLKLIDTIEEALDELDRLNTPEDKAAMAVWFSDFALEAAAGIVAYSRLSADMKATVRKGLTDKHAKIKAHLKGAK